MPAWRLRRGLVLAAVAMLVAMFSITVRFAPTAQAACTIPAANVAVTLTNTSGTNGTTSAWDKFKVQADLSNLDGMAAGCTAVVSLDNTLFGGMQATTVYLNADGSSSATAQADSVATMSIDPTTLTMTFTLTDFASTHTAVTATGWATLQINDSIVRGETQPLTVTINGTVYPVGEITGATCTTDCPGPPTYASKKGKVKPDGSGTVTIVTPGVAKAGTLVTITDTLASADQTILGVASARGYNCVSTWDAPGVLTNGVCDTDAWLKVTVTNSANPYTFTTTADNEFVRLVLNMHFEGAGPWQDTAAITIAGTETTASATVRTYTAGGGAGGTTAMNLKLTKKLETAGPFFRGKTVTYTLTPSNDGPMDALKGWSVTDIAPAGMTITDMTGANYTCDVATGTCTSLVGLPAGQPGAPITVTATINADAVLGSDQKNVAYISPAAGDVKETNVLVVPTLATDTTTSTTDNDAQATLTLANAVSIGDYVWFDTNRDGIQQTGELPVSGVKVNLYAADGTTLVGSTTTDSSGFYSFANLTPSTTYVVEFVKPAGTTFTTQTSTGSTTANDSNPAVTTGRTTVLSPATGTNSLTDPDDPTIDAGLVKYNLTLAKALTSTGTINPGGTVTFNLTPHNAGPVDALAGWSVTDLLPAGLTLVSMTGTGYDCSGNVCTATAPLAAGADGPVIKVTATVDASFTSGTLKNVAYVQPSTDDAVETNPLGTTPTTATDTSTSPTDNDAQAPVTITPLVSIGDYVWYDTNRDGIQNNGEPVYAGMTVQLLDSTGAVVKTTVTDAAGYYYFANLAPSTAYTVKFVAATGETFTTQKATGSTTSNDSNPAVTTGLAPVTTPADGLNRTGAGLTDDPTIDAGVVKYNLTLAKTNTTTGSVYAGSTVTFDLTPHNAGPVDALAGWSVTDLLPTGLTLVSMTGTGYTCSGNVCTATAPLAAGTDGPVIKVTAKVDASFVGSVKNVAYVKPAPGDAVETNPLTTPTTTTNTATTPTDNDAEAPVTVDSLVSIGNYVWWDTNRDGVQDAGEAPVAGVTVTLYQADGTKLGTATTDASGFYSFTDLTPGQPYYVIFTAPADATFTLANAGSNDVIDSDANVATGRADFVAPASGTNSATNPDNPTIDAGLVKMNLTLTKSLSSEGPFGAGDTVKFTLTPHNAGPVDALAGWSVTDLLPAGLTLVSMTGSGYTCSGNVCTSSEPLAAGKDGMPVTVTAKIADYTTGTLHNVAWVSPVSGDTPETNLLVVPGTTTDTDSTATDNDAQASLQLLPVSIGDYVWWDTNRNGLQDTGEAPVEGVTVTLYQADGTTKVAATTTDASGFYSFTDLAPGQAYVVVFTKPDGTTFTTPLNGDVTLDSNPNSSGVAPVVTPKSGTNSATTPDNPTIDAGLVKMNLTLTKSLSSEGPFGAGDTVKFTLTPHNAGPVDALAGWSVTDLLPAGLTLVSMTGSGYTCSGNVCTSSEPLAAGKDGMPVTVTAKIADYTTGTLHNVAWVSPVSGDTPETNLLVVPGTTTDTDSTATDNDAQASLQLLPVSIGDYVWWDTNRNGLQDTGEAPVEGVTVTLYQADGTTKVAATTTDASGFYSFTDLAPGQAYVVVFTKPNGTTFTTQTVGTDTAVDSNADLTSGAAPVVTPKSGANSATDPDDPTIDAGLWQINLSLAKTLTTKGPLHPGDEVTFVLVPHNDGPVDALAGWSVTEVLPKGLTLTSIKGDGYTCTGTTCTSAAILPAGQDGAVIWVTAKITAKATGSLRNVAYVTPAPGETPEVNPGVTPKPGTDTSKTKTDNDADASVDFTAPPAPPTPPLPTTGGAGMPEAFGGGLLLLALGALLKGAARRREEEQV